MTALSTRCPQAEENQVPIRTRTEQADVDYRPAPVAGGAWPAERARRDHAVLAMAARGHTRAHIATTLGLTPGETTYALKLATDRLRARNTAHAVAIAHTRRELACDAADAPRLGRKGRRVLVLVAHGATYEEIAVTLGLSYHTVKTHVRRLLRAFGAADRPHLVDRAFRAGVLVGRCDPSKGMSIQCNYPERDRNG